MSSNPFRKKAPEAIDTARSQSPAKSSLRSGLPLGGKPRTMKRVRVLSPPPLSPELPEWPADTGSLYRGPLAVASLTHPDPAAVTSLPATVSRGNPTAPPNPLAPPNPFSKTLQAPGDAKHLEDQRRSEGLALKAGNAARQSLNVDSFKKLLLTGKTDDADSLLAANPPSTNQTAPPAEPLPADEDLDESSTPQLSSADDSDGDVGLVSAAIPDDSAALARRTPPPPPSSRHGKYLRNDHGESLHSGLPTQVDKLYPSSTARASIDHAPDPSLDRESAPGFPGLDPEDGPELQRDAATTQPSGARKSAPLPPPPRGHARGGSKGNVASAESTSSRRHGEEALVGTDETHAPSDEPRQTVHAPIPPPPRRPPRQATPTSSQVASATPSPTARHEAGLDKPDSPSAATAHCEPQVAGSRLVPPPPRPPTRNPSVKRPASVVSVEGLSRRVSVEKKARDGPSRPPPPPPRQRGSSSGSLGATPRRTSGEGGPPSPHSAMRQSQPASSPDRAAASVHDRGAAEAANGEDILADLDALQREVDALRGQLG